MSDVTIFHNPACGTSRNTLALIRHAGIEPNIVEYLVTPPSKAQVRQLALDIGVPVRGLLREKGTPFGELDLGNPKWTDDELLDFIAQHPILMNRPIVVTPLGTGLLQAVGGSPGAAARRDSAAVHQGRRRSDRRYREETARRQARVSGKAPGVALCPVFRRAQRA